MIICSNWVLSPFLELIFAIGEAYNNHFDDLINRFAKSLIYHHSIFIQILHSSDPKTLYQSYLSLMYFYKHLVMKYKSNDILVLIRGKRCLLTYQPLFLYYPCRCYEYTNSCSLSHINLSSNSALQSYSLNSYLSNREEQIEMK